MHFPFSLRNPIYLWRVPWQMFSFTWDQLKVSSFSQRNDARIIVGTFYEAKARHVFCQVLRLVNSFWYIFPLATKVYFREHQRFTKQSISSLVYDFIHTYHVPFNKLVIRSAASHGAVVQLVKHCTGNAEVMNSKPVEARNCFPVS